MYVNIKKYCIAVLTIVFSTSMYINPIAAEAQEVSTSQVVAVKQCSVSQDNTYSVYANIEIKHSGNYDYQILDDQAKLITIRKIYNYGEEVVFPAEIDGYKVSQIGADKENARVEEKDAITGEVKYVFNESKNTVFSSGTENIKKIVIPEGIQHIGYAAINNVLSLTELDLPKSLRSIEGQFLLNSTLIKSVEFKSSISMHGFVLSDVSLEKVTVAGKLWVSDAMFGKEIDTLYLNGADDKSVSVSEGKEFNNIIIGKDVLSAFLEDVLVKNNVVCMGKKTKLEGHNINMVITEKNSLAMKYCKENKINYTYNDIPKIKKVNVTNKNKKFTYSWKKLKPYKCVCKYDKNSKKWSTSKNVLKYTYKVKGKFGKSKSYKLVKKTQKNKFLTTKKGKIKIECVLKEA